jgi:hypothetical protein
MRPIADHRIRPQRLEQTFDGAANGEPEEGAVAAAEHARGEVVRGEDREVGGHAGVLGPSRGRRREADGHRPGHGCDDADLVAGGGERAGEPEVEGTLGRLERGREHRGQQQQSHRRNASRVLKKQPSTGACAAASERGVGASGTCGEAIAAARRERTLFSTLLRHAAHRGTPRSKPTPRLPSFDPKDPLRHRRRRPASGASAKGRARECSRNPDGARRSSTASRVCHRIALAHQGEGGHGLGNGEIPSFGRS